MNNDLYATMKTILLKYKDEFGKPHTFDDLYSYSKQFKHGQTFKPFVKICQNMGVESVVKRFPNAVGGTKLIRVLIYKPENDLYLKGDITIVETCPKCNGSGIVQGKITSVK